MSFALTENWDGVTAPAIPAGWNSDAEIVTSTTHAYSASNALTTTGGGTGTKYYATYGTSDPGAGVTVDAYTFVYCDATASTGLYKAGVTIRCSASTMNNTSTSCYWINLAWNNAFTGAHVQFDKIVSGTVTSLASVTNGDGGLTRGAWYILRVLCYGSDVFNVTVTRVGDGYTMDSSGNFGPSAVSAISGLTASDITSGPYCGLAMLGQNGTEKLFLDNLNVNGGGAVILPPCKPLVVPIPFQYYHPD